MTPAERVVVEAAMAYVRTNRTREYKRAKHAELKDAVDALLAERAGPQQETVSITWGQVIEGDHIFRAPDGGPCPPDSRTGQWFEVVRSGPLAGTDRMRVNARGIGRPIQPAAKNPVTVKRGATGRAVDVLGAVLWSGSTQPEVRDIAAAIINDPVSEES